MKNPKRPAFSPNFKATLVAAALGALPLSASAASMGRMSVWSGLGQPLRAEVELIATPDEQTTLTARIAGPEGYRQAGLEYTPAISAVRVSVDRRGSRPVIRLSSDSPMKEAFVDILLELSWANGRLAREYTVLLEPVDAPGAARAPGAVAPPVSLPDARMSHSLSQRGASPAGAPDLPAPGAPSAIPPLPAVAPKSASPAAPATLSAKPLPSLKPNYSAAPSEARLTPAAPAPAPAPSGLDPRLATLSGKTRVAEEAPPPPSVQVAQQAAAPETPRPAPVASAPRIEPKPDPKPEPKSEPKPEPKVAPKPERTEPDTKPLLEPIPPLKPLADAKARPMSPPASPPSRQVSELEEELRAIERRQQQGFAGPNGKKLSAKEAAKLAAEQKAAARKAAAENKATTESANTYTVQRGDTLYKIARETKPEEVSLEQMLVALFRNNEGAFEGNMNRLKAGRILSLPDPASVAQTAPQKARREVVAQSADFAAYRNKLASLARSGPARDDAARQDAAGKITPRVEEAAPAARSKDQLKLSRTLGGKNGSSGEHKLAAQEDSAARERALKEANSRVAELEQNVKNLQALISLKNQNMAELQRQAKANQAGQPSPPVDPSKAQKPASPAPGGLPLSTPPASVPMTASGMTQSGSGSETTPPPATPVASAEPPAQTSGVALAQNPAPARPKPPEPAQPAPPANTRPFFAQPLVWGSLSGVGLLLAGWLGWALLRGRRKIATLRPVEQMAEPSDSLAQRLRSAKETMRATVQDEETSASPKSQSHDPFMVPEEPARQVFDADTSVPPVSHETPAAVLSEAPSHLVEAQPSSDSAPTTPAPVALDVAPVVSALTPPRPIPPEPIAAHQPAEPVITTTRVSTAQAPTYPAQPDATPDTSVLRSSIHLELLQLYLERREWEQFDALIAELNRITQGVGPEWSAARELVAMRQSAGSSTARQTSETTGATLPAPVEGLDFDLGEYSSSTPTNTSAPSKTAAAVPGGAPEQAAPPTVAAAAAVSTDAVRPILAAKPFDLSDVDLTLPKTEAPPAQARPPAAQKLDEIGAKLELARAYQEMGDGDGARELLTEVLHEGRPEQQAAAREALAKLG